MDRMVESGPPAHLMLDEIQTLDRWELDLKKFADLKYPVRVIVSGSASTPIFKKSRESLLGRVMDYHLLPFSFREFLLHRLHGQGRVDLIAEVELLHKSGEGWRGQKSGSPEHQEQNVVFRPLSNEVWGEAEGALHEYLVDGGFPEVWSLPTQEKKIEYLFDNRVKKVIHEELALATEFRKPEQLQLFYISLLERAGQEVNLTSLSNDLGINVQQIEKYLPLLETTDLLSHASKFRQSTVRHRQGSRIYYFVELGLRIGKRLLDDASMLGPVPRASEVPPPFADHQASIRFLGPCLACSSSYSSD